MGRCVVQGQRTAVGRLAASAVLLLPLAGAGTARAAIPPENAAAERVPLSPRAAADAGLRMVGPWEAVADRRWAGGRLTDDPIPAGQGTESWLLLDTQAFRHVAPDGAQRQGRWVVLDRIIVRTAPKPSASLALVLDVPATLSDAAVGQLRDRLCAAAESLPGGYEVGLLDAGNADLEWAGLLRDRARLIGDIRRWRPEPRTDRLNDALAAAAQFLAEGATAPDRRVVLLSDGEDGGSSLSGVGALELLRAAGVRVDAAPAHPLTPGQEALLAAYPAGAAAGGRMGSLERVLQAPTTGPSQRFLLVGLRDVRVAGSLVPQPDAHLLITYAEDGRKLVIHEAGEHPDFPATLRRGRVFVPGVYGR